MTICTTRKGKLLAGIFLEIDNEMYLSYKRINKKQEGG